MSCEQDKCELRRMFLESEEDYLRRVKRQRWMDANIDRFRAEAKELGIKGYATMGDWKLLGRVNDANEWKRRPELEARAEQLGVWHNIKLFGKIVYVRGNTDLSLACFSAADVKQLKTELGCRP